MSARIVDATTPSLLQVAAADRTLGAVPKGGPPTCRCHRRNPFRFEHRIDRKIPANDRRNERGDRQAFVHRGVSDRLPPHQRRQAAPQGLDGRGAEPARRHAHGGDHHSRRDGKRANPGSSTTSEDWSRPLSTPPRAQRAKCSTWLLPRDAGPWRIARRPARRHRPRLDVRHLDHPSDGPPETQHGHGGRRRPRRADSRRRTKRRNRRHGADPGVLSRAGAKRSDA